VVEDVDVARSVFGRRWEGYEIVEVREEGGSVGWRMIKACI